MKNNLSKKQLIILSVGVLSLFSIYYFIFHYGSETTDDASLETDVVAISANVSGYIYKINVADNQVVKAGDVILEIDPTDYEIARNRAAAALNSAQAKLQGTIEGFETTKVSAPSSLESAVSQTDLARANWEKALLDLKRVIKLGPAARTQQQLDDAFTAEKVALSNLEDAKARLKSAQTAPRAISAASYSVKELESAVEQSKADVAEAERNLSYTKIIAPFDGVITNRGVAIGSYVQPGQQLLSFVSQYLWVIANFKETQLTNIRPGQKVEIVIDAHPNKKFAGKIDSIQAGTGGRFALFPPENATGNYVKIVQRVPVKVLFDEEPNKDLLIGPGMSVTPTVRVR